MRGVTEPFAPFTTERLTIRAFRPDDADVVAAYRNDPDVARYQDWPMPYPPERAVRVVGEYARVGTEPAVGQHRQLAIELDGTLIGDIALDLDETGTVGHIGYSLARRYHGHGYAIEAVGALVDRVFGTRPEVHRIRSAADPLNLPSIRLLEGLGFVDEGVARQSELIRGEWLDDARFGLLRREWEAWRARPTAPPDDVRFVEITPEMVRPVGRLTTFGWQRHLVAPNLVSLAEALVPEDDDAGGRLVPWYRAIEADGELVGFVMVAEPTATLPDAFLWRLMIDRRHQRRGIGQRALDLVIGQARSWAAPGVLLGWESGLGSPARFYERNGFVPTGEVVGDETFARLTLAPLSDPSQ